MIEVKDVLTLNKLAAYTEELRAKYVRKKDLPTKVSEFANDAGYQTDEQVAAAISAKVSSAYKAGGSAAFDSLPEVTETNLGLVVNVTDAFTTTDDFVEGAGFTHPAGTNVAVVQAGDEYKYDVLAGFVDLSGYATSAKVAEDIAAAVAQVNAATDEKLAGYIKTTDITEVSALLRHHRAERDRC